MKLSLHPFTLRLRHPFTISRGTITEQATLIVELSEGGLHGYGEATENSFYGTTVASMSQSLEAARSRIETYALDDPAQFWADLEEELAGDPFARCALDLAAHDLWGKMRASPVYALWGLCADKLPPTSFTIGIDTIDVMVKKIAEMPGWPIYKIKLGTSDDVAIVRELRRHTDATFRVDANCAWSAPECIENARALRDLKVEFIEQPLPPDDWEGMKHVYADSVLPSIADESCIVESDVPACASSFHGVNIKLVKCGGLTPARRMIEQAKSLGLKTMVGCMTESTVGVSAIAQLLPQLDYVDMDGPMLLRQDIATGVRIERGLVHMAEENGCGVQLVAPPP